MLQLIFTIVFLVWMFLALGVWLLMWWNNTTYTRRMITTLIDVAQKSAEAAQKSAEAAYQLAGERGKPAAL